MKKMTSQSLLPLCRRLASALASDQGAAAFRLLLQSMSAGEPESSRTLPGSSKTVFGDKDTGRVAIWERVTGNGNAAYRRRSNSTRRFWADVEEIPPKSHRKRIVILGESVARGLFYDPHYNPARVLQSILEHGTSGAGLEVVDLAGIDLTLGQLWRLICSSLALKPDLLLVFAGNNWNPYTSIDRAGLRLLWEHTRQSRDWVDARSFIDKKLADDVSSFIDKLGHLSFGHGIPLVVMVPEYNLGDWRAAGQMLPSLGRQELTQWLGYRTKAEQSLAVANADLALPEIEAMLSLDREEVASSLELKGRCSLLKGQMAEARSVLERARDTALNFPFSAAPGCFSVVQKTMRLQVAAKGLTLVDLPAIFKARLQGGLPDRRLFLDYCHMNSDAIRLSMAAVSVPIIQLLGGREQCREDLHNVALKAPARIEALARLFAAQHNFNWGQGHEIVRHHLAISLECDQNVAGRMLEFVDFHTRKAIPLACKSFTSFSAIEPDFAEYYLNALSSERRSKLVLIDALLGELAKIDAPAVERIHQLRQAEHALTDAPVNLLEDFYSKGCYSDLTARLKSRSIHYRSFDLVSRFFVVVDRALPVRLTLSYRVPGNMPGNRLTLIVNERWTHPLSAGSVWRTVSFVVPAEQMRPGVNSIDIYWPLQSQSWLESLGRALELEDPDLASASYRPFGEINVLRAQIVEQPLVGKN